MTKEEVENVVTKYKILQELIKKREILEGINVKDLAEKSYNIIGAFMLIFEEQADFKMVLQNAINKRIDNIDKAIEML